MQRRIRYIGPIFAAMMLLVAGRASATVLPVQIIMQQQPEWCFAASSSMILSFLGYPNLNPAGNYQCGVVGAQGGICAANCPKCMNGGGTMQNVGRIIQNYMLVAQQARRFTNPTVRMNVEANLPPQLIIQQINSGAPILAGISPGVVPYPAGLGVSQHAVVIIGHNGNPANLIIVINDPFPYPPAQDPYVAAGAAKLRTGQYELPLSTFVGVFHYGNSLTFH